MPSEIGGAVKFTKVDVASDPQNWKYLFDLKLKTHFYSTLPYIMLVYARRGLRKYNSLLKRRDNFKVWARH